MTEMEENKIKKNMNSYTLNMEKGLWQIIHIKSSNIYIETY